MIWRHGILLTLCLALSAVAAFYFSTRPQPTPTLWSYADLRRLDPVDANQPTRDLLAIYTRSSREALEIRLDLLEHAAIPDYDLYLALDTQPGGGGSLPIEAQAGLDWDLLLVIPASGEMQALDSRRQPVPRASFTVVRDPVLDQLTISMSQVAGDNQPQGLQIFLTPAGLNQLADQSDPIRAGDPPPPPARVLLAFWNSYPAYTPATALRRWNGAHTGPLGEGHGLLHLLRAARAEQAPLVLLDLKYTASLSALDFIGGLDLARQMEQEGLLIIPEYLPDIGQIEGNMAQTLKGQSEALKKVGRIFELSPSPARYTQPDYAPASIEHPLLFADLTKNTEQPGPLEPVRIARWRDQRLIPIQRSAGQENQAQSDGPSLEARQALSRAALAAAQPGGEAALLVLGGDLPESAWGTPAAASPTLHYLKSRPWIRLLSLQDLLALETTNDPGLIKLQIKESPIPLAQDSQEMLEALSQAPANSLSQAAWEGFLALFAPVYPAPAELPALRLNYSGQVWSLLAAAGWVERPASIATCQSDPDRDGQPECILASEQVYAQFEIEGGALTNLFYVNAAGVAHQIIGPSSQVISGLTDPKRWQLDGGFAADPGVITGAFAEAGERFQPTLVGMRLILNSLDSSIVKTYQFETDGLVMEYHAGTAGVTDIFRIPILLNPQGRFLNGWAENYGQVETPSGLRLTHMPPDSSGVQVEISSNGRLGLQSFLDAIPWMTQPEDPNQDYPASFYLPFPLFVANLSLPSDGGPLTTRIKIIQP